jgi:hypothetical protein
MDIDTSHLLGLPFAHTNTHTHTRLACLNRCPYPEVAASSFGPVSWRLFAVWSSVRRMSIVPHVGTSTRPMAGLQIALVTLPSPTRQALHGPCVVSKKPFHCRQELVVCGIVFPTRPLQLWSHHREYVLPKWCRMHPNPNSAWNAACSRSTLWVWDSSTLLDTACCDMVDTSTMNWLSDNTACVNSRVSDNTARVN